MCQPLPYSGFEWVENAETFDFTNISDSEFSEVGYILEVDLEYPTFLHDKHNDLPFCVEKKEVSRNSGPKLITDFSHKTNYVIHYRNLQQCVKHGLIVKKIHKVLRFNQSCWLEKYISLNAKLRAKASNAFEKNHFKLVNNAVFGKTMENVDKRRDIKIVTEWENKGKKLGARALIAKPHFHSSVSFSDDMIAIEMKRMKVTYDKPIYIGFCVLDSSKFKMYSFHYDYMKPKYDEMVRINYMDTDSFIYTIQTDDFYIDIFNDIDEHFDTSDLPPDNPWGIVPRNRILGMMKDENKGKIIREFVGLRSKMYSIDICDSPCIKKAKGVGRTALQELTIEDYKHCLRDKRIYYRNMFVIRSKVHNLYTQQINKVALSCNDDKRYIRNDGISTYAWGHYQIDDDDLNEM